MKANQSLISNLQSLIPNKPLWAITVLILGGLSFLNTWDVLVHLFVVLGAFVLNRWRRFGWRNQWLTEAIWLAILLVIPAILLYLPFYLGFRSQAGAPVFAADAGAPHPSAPIFDYFWFAAAEHLDVGAELGQPRAV